VEQPEKFEWIIKLKAAEQIGLKIPLRVLEYWRERDRVIR
jgi:hypothetical protein